MSKSDAEIAFYFFWCIEKQRRKVWKREGRRSAKEKRVIVVEYGIRLNIYEDEKIISKKSLSA